MLLFFSRTNRQHVRNVDWMNEKQLIYRMHERPRLHVECVTLDTSQMPCSCPPPGSRTSLANSTARQPLPISTSSPPLLLPIPTNLGPVFYPSHQFGPRLCFPMPFLSFEDISCISSTLPLSIHLAHPVPSFSRTTFPQLFLWHLIPTH
jgi:hypothetical protein